jgi:hypothetical protein
MERKVKAGTAAGAVTGLIVWALVSYVPAFHDGVPEAVVAVIPVVLAWAGHTAAAWLTRSAPGVPAARRTAPLPDEPTGNVKVIDPETGTVKTVDPGPPTRMQEGPGAAGRPLMPFPHPETATPRDLTPA